MVFKELQDEVIRARFKEGQRVQVKQWLNHRLARILSRSDWPWMWALVSLNASLGGSRELELPAGYLRIIRVVDEDGQTLSYLEPQQMFARNDFIENEAGRAGYFTVMRSVSAPEVPTVVLNLVPDADRVYTATALRAARLMVGDAEEPLLPEEYHFLLVLGAVATGLKLENDPTWRDLDEEFHQGVAEMIDAYLPSEHSDTLQFGGDQLGYEFWG